MLLQIQNKTASYFHWEIIWNLSITLGESFALISEARSRSIYLPYCSAFSWIKQAGCATRQSLKEFTCVSLEKLDEEKSLPIPANLLSQSLLFLWIKFIRDDSIAWILLACSLVSVLLILLLLIICFGVVLIGLVWTSSERCCLLFRYNLDYLLKRVLVSIQRLSQI